MESIYHVPVLEHESAELLLWKKNGIYIDGTLGGGGHAESFLRQLSKDSLYIGIDQDPEAIKFASQRLAQFQNFKAKLSRFDLVDNVLSAEGIDKVDGLFLDLGVSSWQIDSDARGFSFRPGVKLDMRMDKSSDVTAEYIVNNYSKEQLKKIFFEYGEEKNSARIASKIVLHRSENAIKTSNDLLSIIDGCVNPRFATKSYARIFQALRIEVNDELNVLKETLNKAISVLGVNGRLVIMTYHSLEDRIVKNFFSKSEDPCVCPPGLPVCACGKKPVLKRIKPFFVTATKGEIANNPRARSAKLRAAVRV
jgi:16S rRNA (cytosine1402-N4)-methyltransferase